MVCTGCGHEMIDAGPVGVECVNRECPEVIRLKAGVRRAFERGESVYAQRGPGTCICFDPENCTIPVRGCRRGWDYGADMCERDL